MWGAPGDQEPIPYERFTCGLTFDQVRADLAAEQAQVREAGGYMFVSRSTVLGRMAQYKREAYEHYLADYYGYAQA